MQPLNPDFFDARVLAFTAAVAVLTGILAGIAPALRVSRIDIHSTLKEARRLSDRRHPRRGVRRHLLQPAHDRWRQLHQFRHRWPARAFNALDTAASQRMAIVNQRMARTFFPNEDPIGKRIKWSSDPSSPAPWMTIVGVSGDVKAWRLNAQRLPEMFTPLSQQPQAFLFLAIRTWSADPSPVAGAVRAALRQMDPGQPITEVRSMRGIVSESLTEVKYVSRMTALFAVIAMLMAAMGIYGVISYSVARRTHESGTADVVRLVLRQALYVVAIGLAIGIAGALAVARLLASWLYGVGEHDPLTFTLVPLALGAVALVASYIPARRATRVDPAVALRCE